MGLHWILSVTGRVFRSSCDAIIPLPTHIASLLPMSDSPDSPIGHAVLKALRASLKLASSSMELLTVSQILAIEFDLAKTLSTFEAQARAIKSSPFIKKILKYSANYYFTGGQIVIVDIDDWAISDDEKNNGNAPRAYLVPSDPEAYVSQES